MSNLHILAAVVLILILSPRSAWSIESAQEAIQGKWISPRYLDFALENGKVVPVKIALKPAHFGMFMYTIPQVLEVAITEGKENESGKWPGTFRSNQSFLDPACAKVEDYVHYSGCKSKPDEAMNLAFRFFEISSNPSSVEKAMLSIWKQSGFGKIRWGFTATAADLSSHVGFVGEDQLILRVNYFKNPLKNPEDAFASKCPKKNKCYVAFMAFQKAPGSSKSSASKTETAPASPEEPKAKPSP